MTSPTGYLCWFYWVIPLFIFLSRAGKQQEICFLEKPWIGLSSNLWICRDRDPYLTAGSPSWLHLMDQSHSEADLLEFQSSQGLHRKPQDKGQVCAPTRWSRSRDRAPVLFELTDIFACGKSMGSQDAKELQPRS